MREGCLFCPRECLGGACGVDYTVKVARSALHYFEEPCISGKGGSGTIFFSGCNLACVFCQNYEISQNYKGVYIDNDKLVELIKRLEGEGAENINFVSPSQYSFAIIKALDKYKPKIPIVYNTNSYEKISAIKALTGYVDIFLPDLKFFSNDLAFSLCGVSDYFAVATSAIEAMHSVVGDDVFAGGMMKRGVIVRHLVLPSHVDDSLKVIDYVAKSGLKLSLLRQYMPCHKAVERKDINRKLTTYEYSKALDYAISKGIEGFSQGANTDNESEFVPNWDFQD